MVSFEDGIDPSDCEVCFDQFILNDEVDKMEAQMQKDQFILNGIALLGQMTVIYAKPNAGKTLLILHLLINSTKSGAIDGKKVYYINADDHYKGLIEKTRIANEAGFMMLAPGHKDFKAAMLQEILKDMTIKNICHGVVVVLDTAKKFTDLMNKTLSSEFFETLRQFVSKNGTVILLAHVNKKRDEDKKVIYAGTADLVDDADCAYTLDEVAFDALTSMKTVQFENFKARGNVELKLIYQYCANPARTSYANLLDSVRRLTDEDCKRTEEEQAAKDLLAANSEAIEAIKEILGLGINTWTEIVNEAVAMGISKRKVIKALKDHTGESFFKNQFWHVIRTGDKNRKEYILNQQPTQNMEMWGV